MPPTVLKGFPAQIKVTIGPDWKNLPATMILKQIPESVEDATLRYSEDGTNVVGATNRLSIKWESYLAQYPSYTAATLSGAGLYFYITAQVFYYDSAYPTYTTWGDAMPQVWNAARGLAKKTYTFLDWFSGTGTSGIAIFRAANRPVNNAYWDPTAFIPYGTGSYAYYSRVGQYNPTTNWQLNQHIFTTMEEHIPSVLDPDKTSYHFG